MSIYWDYFKKLLRHKWFVFISARKLGCSLWLAFIHDWSKFLPSEFIPYAKTFGNNTTIDKKPEFYIGWLHHQKRNKHHWQYWIVQNSTDDFYPLPMPKKYVIEMLADWYGAGLAYGDPDTKKWYQNNYYKIVLHTETRIEINEHFGMVGLEFE